MFGAAAIRSMRYCDIPLASELARTSIVTWLAYREKKSAP